MLWFSFKMISSYFDWSWWWDFKVSSHTVAEEKEIVRSWNQEIHSQTIIIYLTNSESDYFEIIFQTWMKTRTARLQIDLRYLREKK